MTIAGQTNKQSESRTKLTLSLTRCEIQHVPAIMVKFNKEVTKKQIDKPTKLANLHSIIGGATKN